MPAIITSITTIIVVDAIEPCLPFWTERLGFEAVATVPHGEALGFAMLQNAGATIMYQTRASVRDDLVAAAPEQDGLAEELARSTATLFVQVEDLEPVLEAIEGVEVVVGRRQTFYGMDEIFVRAPCGTLVGFAAAVAQEDAADGGAEAAEETA